MFIELTDHLRCPADHAEQYLVLLPGEVTQRSVRTGQLGCPACGRTFAVTDGTLDLGDAPAPPPATPGIGADALAALSGLGGPGGYFVIVGEPALEWRPLAEAMRGVALVAVNPPQQVADEPGISVLRAPLIPVKSSSMRGVVLGASFAGDPHWQREAVRVLLPGLRVVGNSPDPSDPRLDVLASADGWWVAAKTRAA